MLKYFCTFLILIPLYSHAQTADSLSSSSKNIQHQVGLNATSFFKQFLSINSTTLVPPNQFFTPATVDYKIFKVKPNGNRTGARIGFGFLQTDETQNPNSNFKTNMKVTDISARLGIEFQRRIINRWSVYYGFDVIYQNNTRDVTTSFDNSVEIASTNTKEIKEGMGGGPVLGFQFNINRRMSLSTETAFYFLEGNIDSKHRSTGQFGTMPADNTSYFKNMGFTAPAFLNFNIMF